MGIYDNVAGFLTPAPVATEQILTRLEAVVGVKKRDV
jgi:hypothetical protein